MPAASLPAETRAPSVPRLHSRDGLASSRVLLGARLVRALSLRSGLLVLYFAARVVLDGLREISQVF